jgi:hypothetical protein
MQDRTPYRSNLRWSRLSAPLLFTAFALPLFYGSFQAHQKEKAARKLLPIAQRTLTLCSAFSDTCHITGTPILLDERLPRPGKTWKIRHLWSVECVANGRTLNMLLNAATEELSCLYAQGRTSQTSFSESFALPVKTSEEAVEVSLRLMRSLKMVPAGGKIALVEIPQKVQTKKAWQVLWNVRRPDATQPTRIKMLIDQVSGVPILIVDTHTLNKV